MRFFILLLLLICALNANGQLDISEPVEYEWEVEPNDTPIRIVDKKVDSYLVCRPDKADFCECQKSGGRLDCRRDTREKNGKTLDVMPLTSAAIQVKVDGFTPKYVYLNGNKLVSLTQATLMPDFASNVLGLDLSYNDIEFIGERAFDNFNSLTKLRLNQNWIKINDNTDGWITEKLGKKLQYLNLAYNSITTLGDGVFDPLHALEKLILDGNTNLQLTDTTFGPGGIVNLEAISLDNCKFKNLPANLFKNLPKLRYVSLIKNDFTSIPAALKLVRRLQHLDFSENTKMIEWREKEMIGYPMLKKLFLQNMSIEVYGFCAFCGLTGLEILDLSNSKLSRFSVNAFGFVTKEVDQTASLKKLFAEDCKLETLSKVMLPWDCLEEISIGGNPFNCDYRLEWLNEDRQLNLVTSRKRPRCSSPPSKAGQSIGSIQHRRYKPTRHESITNSITLRDVLTFAGVGICVLAALFLMVSCAWKKCHSNSSGGFGAFQTLYDDDINVNEEKPEPHPVEV